MFWVSIILFSICIAIFILTYVVDSVSIFYFKRQDIDSTYVKFVSEEYVKKLGIQIDKPIEYHFVKYNDGGFEAEKGEKITLGTFHEWNNTYYIDISIDLYEHEDLENTIIHETRHMIVEYLREKHIINLTKYSENIALRENSYYNDLFYAGVYLLKEYEEEK